MRRALSGALVSAAIVAAMTVPGAGASPAAGATPAPDDCASLVATSTVRRALGVRAASVAGPESFGPGRCGWHSTDPSCGPRALAIEIIPAAAAAAGTDPIPGDGVIVVDVAGEVLGSFWSAIWLDVQPLR